MKLKFSQIYSLSSQFLLLLYLPINFFVWYFIIINGFSLPIGFSSILALITLLYFIVFIRFQKLDVNLLLLSLFITYCILYITLFYIFKGDMIDNLQRSLFKYHLDVIILGIMSYIIGRNFTYVELNWLLTYFLLMLVLTLYNADGSSFSINLDSVDEELKGIYLGLSDIFCIFSLILFGMINNRSSIFRVTIFFLSILGLFVLNSRSSLYIYFICVAFYLFITLRQSQTRRVVLYLLLTMIGIFIALYDRIINILILNDRMLSIIVNNNDASVDERKYLQIKGIEQIVSNPFLGDYGGVIRIHGSLGAYIHNILSFWQTYGLLVFIIVLYFFIYQPFKCLMLSYKFRYKYDNKYDYVILLSLYLILSVTISKSYGWFSAWFLLGVLHKYLYLFRKKSDQLLITL